MSTYTDLINDIEPKSSDEAVVTSILEKSRVAKRRKVRNISVASFILTVFTAMTITVGAVNNWDYTQLRRSIFNDNQIIAESMENDINYRVVNNTYDGINFKLTGLYADAESLYLIIDITSEKPVFDESYKTRGGALSSLTFTSNSNTPIVTNFTYNDFNFHLIDETRMIATVLFTEPFDLGPPVHGHTSYIDPYNDAIGTGREFSLRFGDTIIIKGAEYFDGLPLKGGKADLLFTVDSINEQNVILLYPAPVFGDDVKIKEIRVTPFNIIVRFDGGTGGLGYGFNYIPDYGLTTKISFLMNNGKIIPLEVTHNDEGMLSMMGSGYYSDYKNYSWVASFKHDMLLNINEVAAVIINGIEISVTD